MSRNTSGGHRIGSVRGRPTERIVLDPTAGARTREDRLLAGCNFDPYFCRAHGSERASILDTRCRIATAIFARGPIRTPDANVRPENRELHKELLSLREEIGQIAFAGGDAPRIAGQAMVEVMAVILAIDTRLAAIDASSEGDPR